LKIVTVVPPLIIQITVAPPITIYNNNADSLISKGGIMSKKIKFTRNELKFQRESLARYQRFLPTLELKKMQLELERRKIQQEVEIVEQKMNEYIETIMPWHKLFGEAVPKKVMNLVSVQEVIVRQDNIAGIFIPVYQSVVFQIEPYSYWTTPPWVEKGIEAICKILEFREHKKVLYNQDEIIAQELRRTTQRCNLFKERLIPECKENIRRISIGIGDMQASAVFRSKIAKQKNADQETYETSVVSS